MTNTLHIDCNAPFQMHYELMCRRHTQKNGPYSKDAVVMTCPGCALCITSPPHFWQLYLPALSFCIGSMPEYIRPCTTPHAYSTLIEKLQAKTCCQAIMARPARTFKQCLKYSINTGIFTKLKAKHCYVFWFLDQAQSAWEIRTSTTCGGHNSTLHAWPGVVPHTYNIPW